MSHVQTSDVETIDWSWDSTRNITDHQITASIIFLSDYRLHQTTVQTAEQVFWYFFSHQSHDGDFCPEMLSSCSAAMQQPIHSLIFFSCQNHEQSNTQRRSTPVSTGIVEMQSSRKLSPHFGCWCISWIHWRWGRLSPWCIEDQSSDIRLIERLIIRHSHDL